MGGEKRLVTTVIMELFFFLNLVGTEKEMERAKGEKKSIAVFCHNSPENKKDHTRGQMRLCMCGSKGQKGEGEDGGENGETEGGGGEQAVEVNRMGGKVQNQLCSQRGQSSRANRGWRRQKEA